MNTNNLCKHCDTIYSQIVTTFKKIKSNQLTIDNVNRGRYIIFADQKMGSLLLDSDVENDFCIADWILQNNKQNRYK